MTEPITAEEYAIAMQRDNSLTPMHWIRKAMLQAYREGCDEAPHALKEREFGDTYADIFQKIENCRNSKKLEDF